MTLIGSEPTRIGPKLMGGGGDSFPEHAHF